MAALKGSRVERTAREQCTHPQAPRDRRSPISTNQRREMLQFLARIFVSHAGITNNGSAHTDSERFCRFWFNRPNTAKWLYGCLQGNRLRTISSSNLSDTTDKIWDLFFLFLLLSLSFLSFFLSSFLCIALSDSWRFSLF